MNFLFKISGLFAKVNHYSKFFVVIADIAEYSSKKFAEAYPPEQAPKEEPEEVTEK
jgi:hypothetical protein